MSKVNVLMVGTGEYTTGYVGGTAADSDKGAGVVALTMFDLRRRSKVDRVGMCGVNVSKSSVVRLMPKRDRLSGPQQFFDVTFFIFSGQEIPRYPKSYAKEYWGCLQRYGLDV